MKNLKKYIAPSAEAIKVGMASMCCGSLTMSDTPADSKLDVMSKKGDLVFGDEEDAEW